MKIVFFLYKVIENNNLIEFISILIKYSNFSKKKNQALQ